MANQIHICTEMTLPDELQEEAKALAEKENPNNGSAGSSALEMAIVNYKVWAPGRTLRVRFLDGHPSIQQKVTQIAQEWSQYANIHFDFGNHAYAEIRISFALTGSWSYIGTDALSIPEPQATMNFGWFHANTPDEEYRRVVLHEFGHALGYIHEHQNPADGIPWDTEAVYGYYQRTNGWDRETTKLNVLDKYDQSLTNFTAFDPHSIMLYPVAQEVTVGDFAIPWQNSELSESDKAFIRGQYPF